ncbi:MFS transporter [Fangia hongkongensis]|uniref:MFS transporter n=1 Tax=Fangia hongkongensis TaxID=270495 RepID=UPI00037968CB|nr:MFS transporter [Fangia hongkongensis]MBK2126045.1 MFS transporter [Fangia hongkongensis]
MQTIGILKIAILLSYICIASLSAAIITPGLHDIQIQFQLSSGALNWVVSIFLLGYVLGQLIYGPLSNRYGRLSALRGGLTLNLIGIIISLYAAYNNLYALLLIGRVVTALGASAGLSITYTLIHELLPESKAKHALSFSTLAFTIGIAISVTLGGVITQYLIWYDCFYLLLLHGMIMLGLTWQFKETLEDKQPLSLSRITYNYTQALKSPKLIIFSLLISLLSIFSYGYAAIAPLYAENVLHLSPDSYGYWNIINTIGMFVSSFLASFLLKRYSTAKTLLILMTLSIPFILGLLLLSVSHLASAGVFFGITMFLYLIMGAIMGPGSHLAIQNATDKASSSGMMSFINMGMATLVVTIMGYLPLESIKQLSYTLSFVFIIIALLTCGYFITQRAHHTLSISKQ